MDARKSKPMSYEGKMLKELKMPNRKKVEESLLIALFKNNGVIKEFSTGEEIVYKIADDFGLNKKQRAAYLETVYRKENRIKRSLLWHRLLFRAADSLARQQLVSRPTQTLKLTNKKEWMLTEKGFDKTLRLLNIPLCKKDSLSIKSFEVQKIVKKLTESRRPENYNPFDEKKRFAKVSKESALRSRGFRQAVIEAYYYKCAVCGLKICSPDFSGWEVEAAHIVPIRALGKDDIWNALALCHLHHWAFDVGWFTLLDDYKIKVSSQVKNLASDFGKMWTFKVLNLNIDNSKILLPVKNVIFPHRNSLIWHRKNVFQK